MMREHRTGRRIEPHGSTPQTEVYTIGYSSVAVQRMAGRDAAEEAAFFLPYLRPGISLLDCGCGPGTITAGLAAAVAPGPVAGIDIDPGQIDLARSHAAAIGVVNVRFQVADIYRLPFPADSFDAVFVHTVLEHLRDPLGAVGEALRVLKPGGLAGVRNSDHSGDLIFPPLPMLRQSLRLYDRLLRHNGSNPRIGRRLRSLLRRAGFAHVVASASYECFGTPEATRTRGEFVAHHLLTPPFSDQVVELGWVDFTTLERMSVAWRRWGEHPEAFWAHARCEAVGRKE